MLTDPFPVSLMVNISDLITVHQINFYKISSNVIFVTSVICLSFYGLVVIFYTPVFMKNFKILILLYIFGGLTFQLSYICWKPLLLQPFNVIYPIGFCAPMDRKISAGVTYLAVGWSYTTMSDALLCIIMERYFLIAIPIYQKMKIVRISIYLFLVISNILTFMIVFILVVPILPDEKDISNILPKHIIGINEYLEQQPSLYFTPNAYAWGIVNKDNSNQQRTAVDILEIGGLIYTIPRLTSLFSLIPLNFCQVKSINTHNTGTQRQLNIMTVVFIIQLSECIIFYVIPIGFVLLTYVFNIGIPKYFGFTCTSLVQLATFAPVIDFCIMMMFITPYRKAVKKMIFQKRWKNLFSNGSPIIHVLSNT